MVAEGGQHWDFLFTPNLRFLIPKTPVLLVPTDNEVAADDDERWSFVGNLVDQGYAPTFIAGIVVTGVGKPHITVGNELERRRNADVQGRGLLGERSRG